MDYKTKKVWHFLAYINKYLSGDLRTFKKLCDEFEEKEKQLEEAKRSHGTSGYGDLVEENITASFRMTQPITLSLFATLDVLGYLTGPHKATDNTKNMTNFFDYYVANNQIDQDELNLIINVFRHGITHNFFPKLDVGISYHSKHEHERLFFLLEESGNKTLTLNVNKLKRLVVDRLSEVIAELEKMNEPFPTDIEKKYTDMTNVYEGIGGDPTKKSPRDYIEVVRAKLSTSL